MVGSCFNKIGWPGTVIGLHRGCFPGNFPKSVEQSFRCYIQKSNFVSSRKQPHVTSDYNLCKRSNK